jgi:phosphate-selective porin OprO and OprP
MTTLTTFGRSICVMLLLAAGAAPALAQSGPPSDSAPTAPSAEAVIERLTRQVAALEAELARLGAAARPEPASPAAELARLSAELDALDQRVRLAQRKLELEKEQDAEVRKAQPRIGAGGDGFSLKSADGAFQLKLRGYVQSDGRFYAPDSAAPATDTFVLRRVRPVLEATMFGRFDFKVMPDFGLGTVVLQDAYLDLRLAPLAKVRAGKFKAPFGLERLVSATELLFTERAAPTSLAPNRDLGVMLFGDTPKGRFSYQLAVQNGVPDGGSADLDERAGKDVIARVFVRPFSGRGIKALEELGLAAAIDTGTDTGTRATPALPTYKTTGQQTFFRYRNDATAAGTAIAAGDRLRTSLQESWSYSRLNVTGEFTTSTADVALGNRIVSVRNRAYVIGSGFLLSGEPALQRQVSPRREFGAGRGKYGAFELTGRISKLTIDDAAFPLVADPTVSARSAFEWSIGTNWYLNRSVKLTLDYVDTRFQGGAKSGNRPAERALLNRFQFAF